MRIEVMSPDEVAKVFGPRSAPGRKADKSPRPRRPLKGANVPLLLEQRYWAGGVTRVVGVDEAGNGAICAAVAAAAVELPANLNPSVLADVRDSKLIQHRPTRERLAHRIRAVALRVGLGAASPAEIGRLTPDGARALAIRRALRRVEPYEIALIDGDEHPDLVEGRHVFVPKGEGASLSIACAGLVAKTTRDHLLGLLSRRHPEYGWEDNEGYATEKHIAAIQLLGATPHHHGRNRAVRRALAVYLASQRSGTASRRDLTGTGGEGADGG